MFEDQVWISVLAGTASSIFGRAKGGAKISRKSVVSIHDQVAKHFDAAFYLSRYPDVALSSSDPLEHYLEHGWREGRNPSPSFDTNYYLDAYDLRTLQVCPLVHYAEFGHRMGLITSNEAVVSIHDQVAKHFDADFYLSRYPDVALSSSDPLEHYLEHGWREGRNPSPSFDTNYYLDAYDLRTLQVCPLVHYAEFGHRMGLITSNFCAFERFVESCSGQIERFIQQISRDPAALQNEIIQKVIVPMFCSDKIRQRHGISDQTSDFECFIRYLVFDLEQGLSPGYLFDGDYYCTQALRRGLCPPADPQFSFQHWLKVGLPNKVSPASWYSDENYVALNPDLADFPEWPFLHLIRHGLSERRRFHPTIILSGAIHPRQQRTIAQVILPRVAAGPEFGETLNAQLEFWRSPTMKEITRRAAELEPGIHQIGIGGLSYQAPWHDDDYQFYSLIRKQITGPYDSVILTPFCKLGGADFVGGVLAHSLVPAGRTLLIRTDQSDWERPDWFPPEMDTVDLSGWFAPLRLELRKRILYELIRSIEPKNVFNVNSRTAFETFVDYGARLQKLTNIFSYYFCADRTSSGQEVGYPIDFFANLLPFMRGALFDTDFLKRVLEERFCLSQDLKDKLYVLRTPALSPVRSVPLVEDQIARRSQRIRPTLIWAGRLDRQKRFDLLIEIAGTMPDVLFQCWGKAVLDAEPSRSNLPSNLTIHAPFKSYEELPLRDCDGLLFTSAWEGMPTILIEFAAMGMPIVASAVGGVPELIDNTTGWPVAEDATCDDYVSAIRDFLSDPKIRIDRTRALQDRVRANYNRDAYDRDIKAIIR